MKTTVNLKEINGRIDSLIEKFNEDIVPNPCDGEHDQLVNLPIEEYLYLLLLETHFHSYESANRMLNELSWNKLEQSAESEILKSCKTFFKQPKIKIGDHRKYFRCLSIPQKINYTVEVLCSYRTVVKEFQSQKKFFEIDGKPEFDIIYERMKDIKHFEGRLPRFDHLEKLNRAFNFYCIPERFYVEDSSGPLDGLTYLIIGERFKGNKTQLKAVLFSKTFVKDWNTLVKAQSGFSITQGEPLNSILQKMEHWAIINVRKRLPKDKRGNPAFVFDLETKICNWQKRK